MSRARLAHWSRQPFVTGWWALLCGVGAVAVPTLVRFAVDGAVTGCEFTPYLPFILLSAILLRWWQAAAIALASAAIFSGLFISPLNGLHDQSCVASAVLIFLAASAMTIGTVMVIRRAVAGMFSHGDDISGGVVFSMEEGQVWASWYGKTPPVCLGSQKKVDEMMRDFLAQEELGQRLTRQGG